MKKKNGFTLGELLSVVAIVGIFTAAVAVAGDMRATTLTAANTAVRFTAHQIGRGVWVDARNVLPAGETVTVYRTYSGGTDTVATVVCTNGVGRGPFNAETWYAIYGEYFKYTGPTNSATVRVITTP
jgi:prepilin-type N-terminal cleavage/methylation domain-containing protein